MIRAYRLDLKTATKEVGPAHYGRQAVAEHPSAADAAPGPQQLPLRGDGRDPKGAGRGQNVPCIGSSGGLNKKPNAV